MGQSWKDQPSALDARTRVVRALKRHGGAVKHPTGFASALLQQELGQGRSLTEVLARMEQDGMIVREIRGRRTYAITLVDDAGLAPDVQPAPDLTPLPASGEDVIAATTRPESVPADDQAEIIAAKLLEMVVRKATERVPDTQDIARLQGEVARIRDERDEARQTIARLLTELSAAQEQVRLIQHNLDVLAGKRQEKAERDGVSVAERLDPKTRRQLAALSRALDKKAS